MSALPKDFAVNRKPHCIDCCSPLPTQARAQNHAMFFPATVRRSVPFVARMGKRSSGFTLIEIAIVLVVIGLLLGGVFKGQELIVQGRIKNIANDYNGIAAAVLSYQERYRSLPGDDARASARWPDAAVGNGNGNGRLEGSYSAADVASESRLAWLHLRQAGFLHGSGNAPINHPAGGVLGVQNGAGSGELAGLVVCADQLPGKIAAALDSQLDDGEPNRGQMRGFTDDGAGTGTLAASVAAYVENESTLYVVCRRL